MNTTLTEEPKMYETESDIPGSRRSELNALMNQRLVLKQRNKHDFDQANKTKKKQDYEYAHC